MNDLLIERARLIRIAEEAARTRNTALDAHEQTERTYEAAQASCFTAHEAVAAFDRAHPEAVPRPAQVQQTITHEFRGAVGAVQTGEGSTVTVRQS